MQHTAVGNSQEAGAVRDDIGQDDPYIAKLFALVSNHTLTIEILAKALANSADTPVMLYHKIGNPEQHTRMRNVDGLVERNFSEEPLTPFECIRLLFNLSHLEQDKDFEYKSQVLVFMAAMPTRGIELSLFKKWSDNRIIRAKNSLVQKSWLRQDTVKGVALISMHPLIREIVWSELEPDLDRCALLIENFMNNELLVQELDGLYHQSRQIKEQYETVALSLLASFPVSNLSNLDFYFKLQVLFHYSARSDYALSLACTIDVWRSKYEVICGNLEKAEMLINRAEEAFTCHGYAKEYADEIEYLKAAAMIHAEGFGEYHRAGIERGIKLATAYRNNGRPEDAIKVLTHYQKIAEEMLGEDAALSVTIRDQLS